MSESKLIQSYCAVRGCKSSILNKSTTLAFHKFPTRSDIRNKWVSVLKTRCVRLDVDKSRICSKHFQNQNFDASRRLRDNAVPSLFPVVSTAIGTSKAGPKSKVDRLLNRMTQAELIDDINSTMQMIKVPDNFSDCVDDHLQCVSGTPVEAQLWLLIKKHDHLITRLNQSLSQNKKHIEVLQKNIEDVRSTKNSMENNLESFKYIVKCLQEKQASLEEQVEILTAVESR